MNTCLGLHSPWITDLLNTRPLSYLSYYPLQVFMVENESVFVSSMDFKETFIHFSWTQRKIFLELAWNSSLPKRSCQIGLKWNFHVTNTELKEDSISVEGSALVGIFFFPFTEVSPFIYSCPWAEGRRESLNPNYIIVFHGCEQDTLNLFVLGLSLCLLQLNSIKRHFCSEPLQQFWTSQEPWGGSMI